MGHVCEKYSKKYSTYSHSRTDQQEKTSQKGSKSVLQGSLSVSFAIPITNKAIGSHQQVIWGSSARGVLPKPNETDKKLMYYLAYMSHGSDTGGVRL